MAVLLYKQGTTHTIRGTLCEMGRFLPDEVHAQLENGWFKSPADAYDLQAEEEPEAKEIEAEPASSFDGMSNKDIREAAKEAGIESWDTTRIKTLKAELS